MKKWKSDLILGITLLLVSLILLIYTITLDSPRVKLFLARPDTYMALWISILSILSICLIIQALENRKKGNDEKIAPLWGKASILTVVLVFIYLLTLKYMGFIINSIILMWVLSFMYTIEIGDNKESAKDKIVLCKYILFALLFAIISTMIVYFLFTFLLSTKLPKCKLF